MINPPSDKLYDPSFFRMTSTLLDAEQYAKAANDTLSIIELNTFFTFKKQPPKQANDSALEISRDGNKNPAGEYTAGFSLPL